MQENFRIAAPQTRSFFSELRSHPLRLVEDTTLLGPESRRPRYAFVISFAALRRVLCMLMSLHTSLTASFDGEWFGGDATASAYQRVRTMPFVHQVLSFPTLSAASAEGSIVSANSGWNACSSRGPSHRERAGGAESQLARLAWGPKLRRIRPAGRFRSARRLR